MIPTNLEEQGCDPTSSNCVIWQGPDLDCIKLCKGDTITTVTYKLATELCSLLEQFELTNYDLSCLNLLTCTPEDFKALIQVLIDKICLLESIEPSTSGTGSGCPDCTVEICEDFYYQSPQGDTLTSMQLTDYVLAIGNRVCTIINQIVTINSALEDHENRIDTLENATTPDTDLPQITPECVLPSVPTNIDTVLAALEIEYCNLVNYTGTPTDILQALTAACQGLNTANKLNGVGQMNTIQGWYPSPINFSQSFSNLWKTVCDMREAIVYLQSNIDLTCSAVDVDITATVLNTNTVRLFFTGNIPNNFSDTVGGSAIVLTNPGGLPQTISNILIKSAHFDTGTELDITLTSNVNSAQNIEITSTLKVSDTVQGFDCQNALTGLALGTDACPVVTIIPSFNGITYSFPWLASQTFITANVYLEDGVTLVQSSVISVSPTTGSGDFQGLVDDTNYKLQLVIGGSPCDFVDFTTLLFVCTDPSINTETITYVNLVGDQTPSTIGAWVTEYESLVAPVYP